MNTGLLLMNERGRRKAAKNAGIKVIRDYWVWFQTVLISIS